MLPPPTKNITELVPGDQLRIALKAGHAVEANEQGILMPPNKPRRARGFSRTTFYAYLVKNEPSIGQMTVNIQDMIVVTGKISTAVIHYKSMLVLQQIIPYGRPVVETAPKTHPGTAALGTKMSQLFPQPYLVRVLFTGK